MESNAGMTLVKKAKFVDKISMCKPVKWKKSSKIPVCVVEDHCKV